MAQIARDDDGASLRLRATTWNRKVTTFGHLCLDVETPEGVTQEAGWHCENIGSIRLSGPDSPSARRLRPPAADHDRWHAAHPRDPHGRRGEMPDQPEFAIALKELHSPAQRRA
jgi:hypothetical protein